MLHCHPKLEWICVVPKSYHNVDHLVDHTAYGISVQADKSLTPRKWKIRNKNLRAIFTLMPSLIELSGMNFNLNFVSPSVCSSNDSIANCKLFNAMRASPSQISANHFIDDSSTPTLSTWTKEPSIRIENHQIKPIDAFTLVWIQAPWTTDTRCYSAKVRHGKWAVLVLKFP